MTPGSKILVGAVATAALAAIFHGPLGFGKSFVDRLETEATGMVTADGVTATADRDSAYRRGVTLSGPVTDPAKRDALLAQVRAIPGMAFARWADDGAAKAAPAADGPPASAEQVKECQSDVDAAIKGKTVQFQSGTATLSVESGALIDELSKAIGACAGTKVEVAGHTDLTGGDEPNMRLSEERANSVVAAMVAKGVPSERLVPKGYGETKPLEATMSSAANAMNRRIEFHVATAAEGGK